MHMQPYCICICICKCNQGHKMTFLFILQKGVGRERERKLRERKKQFILLQSVETFITPSLKIELSRKFNIRQNYNYYHYTHIHTHISAQTIEQIGSVQRLAVTSGRLKKRWKEVIIARKAIYTSMNCSLNVDAVHVSQLCCISYTCMYAHTDRDTYTLALVAIVHSFTKVESGNIGYRCRAWRDRAFTERQIHNLDHLPGRQTIYPPM